MPGKRPLSHGKRPPSTITPPIAVPCPQMNLVAECTTMSAPHSSGRHRYGDANVLSTTSGTPTSWASAATASMSSTSMRGVADGLGVERLGPRGHRVPPLLQVGPVDEARVDPDLAEAHVELLVGAAVEAARRDELVAGLHQGEQRQVLRGLAGRGGDRPDAVLQRGDPLLEHPGRRVHDPAVDVAEPLQREQVGRVVGVLEHVGAGLVDRHRAAAGDRVRALPRVDGQRVQPEPLVLHARHASARRPIASP